MGVTRFRECCCHIEWKINGWQSLHAMWCGLIWHIILSSFFLSYQSLALTHYGLVMASSIGVNIGSRDGLLAWRHQTITWFPGTCLNVLSVVTFLPSIIKVCEKINRFKWQTHFPGANELIWNQCRTASLSCYNFASSQCKLSEILLYRECIMCIAMLYVVG